MENPDPVGNFTENVPPTDTAGTLSASPKIDTWSTPDMLSGRFMSPCPPVSCAPDPVTLALVSTKWKDGVLSRTLLVVLSNDLALIDGPPHALTGSSTAVVIRARRRKPAMMFPPNPARYPRASIGVPIHCHA